VAAAIRGHFTHSAGDINNLVDLNDDDGEALINLFAEPQHTNTIARLQPREETPHEKVVKKGKHGKRRLTAGW
jgi:hypothetical protein